MKWFYIQYYKLNNMMSKYFPILMHKINKHGRETRTDMVTYALGQYNNFKKYCKTYKGKRVMILGEGESTYLSELILLKGQADMVYSFDKFCTNNKIHPNIIRTSIDICEASLIPDFDIIVSNSTLEHLHKPFNAIENMQNALKEGGIQIHKIDLKSHGMFKGYKSISCSNWDKMTSHNGKINRLGFYDYWNYFEFLSNLDYEIVEHKQNDTLTFLVKK